MSIFLFFSFYFCFIFNENKNIYEENIFKKIPIKLFLEQKGIVSNNFNDAPVSYVEFKNGEKFILKEYKDDDLLSLVVSVSIAYFCKLLEFPKTPNVFINKNLLFQEFIDFDLLKENEILAKFNTFDKEYIDNLKVFYFIFGYLDTCFDNILFKDKDLFVIDMDTCSNISFCKYGDIPYVRIWSFGEGIKDVNYGNFPFDSFKSLENENDKVFLFNYLKVLGNEFLIEKFRLNKRKIKYILFKNNLFVQFFGSNHEKDIDYIMPFSKNIKKEFIDKILLIDEKGLSSIFYSNLMSIKSLLDKDEFCKLECNLNFLVKNIIDRKKQVINYYFLNN